MKSGNILQCRYIYFKLPLRTDFTYENAERAAQILPKM